MLVIEMSCIHISIAWHAQSHMRYVDTFIGMMQPRNVNPMNLLHRRNVQRQLTRSAMRPIPGPWLRIDDVQGRPVAVALVVAAHAAISSPTAGCRGSIQKQRREPLTTIASSVAQGGGLWGSSKGSGGIWIARGCVVG